MSAVDLHREGDCGPSCPICAQECDECGHWLSYCICTHDDTEEES